MTREAQLGWKWRWLGIALLACLEFSSCRCRALPHPQLPKSSQRITSETSLPCRSAITNSATPRLGLTLTRARAVCLFVCSLLATYARLTRAPAPVCPDESSRSRPRRTGERARKSPQKRHAPRHRGQVVMRCSGRGKRSPISSLAH